MDNGIRIRISDLNSSRKKALTREQIKNIRVSTGNRIESDTPFQNSEKRTQSGSADRRGRQVDEDELTIFGR